MGIDISCFLRQNFSLPVYKGEIQAQNLGMAMEVWNEEGDGSNGSKYRKAYFSKFPGIWAHGDCRINPKTGGIVMLGWSVPSPVSTVDSFKEVEDSLCVPQYNKYGEERVILFLEMASGHAFQPDLVKRIHDTIHVGLSVRHVLSLILETKGIPYTLNGKKVEVAVKQIVAGKAVEQRGAFSNPEALHLYWDIPELQGF
uniref:Acetoacetyl-CoA synthetase n=1 Tax=Macaca nemestrina TaxID=9545 RepID=A0A2K6E0I8_MACNE